MTTRFSTPILLVIVAFAVACDRAVEPPPFITLEVSPTDTEILQTASASVVATLMRSGGVAGAVDFTVVDVPTGVDAVVSKVQTVGLVTTATISLSASGSATPGVYTLTVRSTEAGSKEITATFKLTVEESVSCLAGGAVCQQWATGATASSEYTSTDWSAKQATGPPNSASCQDDGLAWASLNPDTQEWLEVTFEQIVIPTEIDIYEVLGVSSIVKVEVKDPAGAYYTVYIAQPASGPCPHILTIPVAGISTPVNAVRISFDQAKLNFWNEIDAVKLVGQH
jgi:hypothetical protein